MKRFHFLLIIGFFLGQKVYSQIDTLFWFAAPEVSIHNQNFDRPILLRITTYSAPATVTISQPAGGGMPTQIVNIPANSTQTVNLTNWIDFIETKPANTVLNYGLKIHSTAFISIYYEVQSIQCQCNPEIFVLKGENALGTDFWIPHQTFLNNNSVYSPQPFSSFDIIATEDNTQITITPSNNVVGNPAGVPYVVTLNSGQVYSATATSQLASQRLNGSRVTSNKPIAITIKDDLMLLQICSDLGGDQIVPTNILGTKYALMKGFLNVPDKIFVLATQNNTSISVNGSFITTINQGQTYTYDLSANSAFLETSAPVYVLHLSGYGCEVGMSLLPSIECTGSSSVSIVRSTNESLFANIIVPDGFQGNFTVNGNPGVITPANFSPVPGTSGQWVSAQITLPSANYPQNTPILIQNSASIFHLGMIHGGSGSGTRYGYFSNYATIASNPTASDSIYCEGDSINLFGNTLVGAAYSWLGPNNFTSSLQNPVIYNATTNMTGWYKLLISISANCSEWDSVFITVNPKPNPPIINDTTLCAGNSITLQFQTENNTQYFWYDQNIGGNLLQTGNSFTTPTLNNSVTYYIEAISNGCTATRKPVNVTVNPIPNPPIINDTTLCAGNSITLQFQPQNNTQYFWYDQNTGGNLLQTGNSFTTPTLNNSVTYYIEAISNGCTATRKPVNVTVNPTPNQPIINDTTLCAGNSLTLQFQPENNTQYFWYDQNTGGNLLQTGNSFTTPTLNNSVTYYIEAISNGCTATRKPVNITVSPIPNPPIINDTTLCAGNSLTLQFQPENNTQYFWYDQNIGGNLLQTGNSFTTPTLNNSVTYYIEAISNGCTATRKPVNVTVNPTPNQPNINDTTLCAGNSITLQFQPENNTQYFWYDQNTGGNLLQTGNSFTTPTLNNSVTYYIEAISNGCTATRKPVNVTVINVSVEDSSISICQGERLTIDFSGISGLVNWYDGNGNFITQSNLLIINSILSDTLFIYEFVTQGCTSNRATFSISVYPNPIADFSAQPSKDSVVNVQDANYVFNNLSQGASYYVWYFGDGDTLVTTDLIVPHQYTREGEYYVKLCAYNNWSCKSCFENGPFIISNEWAIFIPNVFTPNQDGINDEFKMIFKGIKNAEIIIYDRWGIEIFSTKDAKTQFWNGTKNGKICPEGVYTYHLKAIKENNQSFSKFGTITLLR